MRSCCQREIVKQIVKKDADYVIAVKSNQQKLLRDIEQLFEEAIQKRFEGFNASTYSTKEFSHGREEIRNYVTLDKVAFLVDPNQKWENLYSIGMVESVRTVNGKTSSETRYYISSIINKCKKFGNATRSHWGIENELHWVLDVSFSEDDCRIRKGNASQNFAVVRHIATNLIKREKSVKLGVKNKRLKAGWDEDYLEKILEL